ncbi:CoA-binding protein [Streptococcus sp. zg-JUN1979]|uniref:CoA-binding protein n=1 Tax=Streptococcus sp. zg-JUN1979 TaxID=3391450 RepID=UPI0039A6B8BD
MTYHFTNPTKAVIDDYMRSAKTIAVVGLSPRETSPAYKVAKRMQEAGYRIVGINPRYSGELILGEPVYESLATCPVALDIVDVFRPSEALADVARDFLKTDAKVFWAQLGLESQEAEQLLREQKRDAIVMNKCLKIEYDKMR